MRIIDADALKLAIPETSVDAFQNCRNCVLLDNEQVNELIDAAPTIDIDRPTRSQFKRMAVQLGYELVVRCSECKHHVAGYCCRDINGRTNMFRMFDNDFCSYGKRRADFVDDNKIGERKNDV